MSNPKKTRHPQAATMMANGDEIHIALTREEGKNEKLLRALSSSSPPYVLHELPCIAHAQGPDTAALSRALDDKTWDSIIITSPEAARVLATAWNDSCTSSVAAVGKATQKALEDAGIAVDFVPSIATAACLVEELPFQERVLYPASAQARPTVVEGLTARGMEVTRLDTYDTATATWTAEQQQVPVEIACFASPSAVKGWVANVRKETAPPVLAACIGETSAEACRQQEGRFLEVLHPNRPGLEGWVDIIHDAAAIVRVMKETRPPASVDAILE